VPESSLFKVYFTLEKWSISSWFSDFYGWCRYCVASSWKTGRGYTYL